MACFQQLFYCKNCKKNVPVNEKGYCSFCNSSSLNKSWSVRFRYVQEDGKEVQKRLSGYSTRREANDAYIKFTAAAKIYDKTDKETRELTFSDLFIEYCDYQKSRIKESSYITILGKCKNHILPFFKNYNVKDISPKLLLNWQKTIDKYAFRNKMAMRSQLSSILNYAEKYYKIPNQLKYVDSFRRIEKPEEMQIWSIQEFEKFLNAVKDYNYKVFFLALFYMGTRKGEMLATTWKDWDFNNATLNINKTLNRKTYAQKPTITAPKNLSSIRKISVPTHLIEILKNYKQNCSHTSANDLVFKLSESSIDRYKKRACIESGVKEIRLHDFRHSHASILISNGVSIVAVAKRLGHSNITQTLNTYSHLMEHEDNKLLNTLNKSIKL